MSVMVRGVDECDGEVWCVMVRHGCVTVRRSRWSVLLQTTVMSCIRIPVSDLILNHVYTGEAS